MDTAVNLLDRAAICWLASRAHRRDALLEVGRLLRQFLEATIREDEIRKPCVGNVRRGAAAHARLRGTATAAKRLGVSRQKINDLVCASAVADLLRPQGDLGQIPWTSLRVLRVCVRRRKQTIEDWEIAPDCQAWAALLLAEVVAGSWGQQRTQEELRKRQEQQSPRSRSKGRRDWPSTLRERESYRSTVIDREDRHEAEAFVEVRKLAGIASPADLADLIADIVRRSCDPERVKQLLLERLEKETLTMGVVW